ncbi:MAG: hypothetical protein J0L65_16440, partial [Xanthomonadales bacterium]|nr:hypothetical protein [Xanthomonadales bacterium]
PLGAWFTIDNNGAVARVQYVWHSQRKQLHLFAALILASPPDPLAAQPAPRPLPDFWHPDGPVYALSSLGETLYLGGNFTYVGPINGSVGAANASDGTVTFQLPELEGDVLAIARSAAGDLYLGGNFTLSRGGYTNLVRILPNGQLDPWFRPYPTGPVRALALGSGHTLYVGGDFQRISGTTRRFLTGLDATSGAANAWAPACQAAVHVLTVSGDTVFVGGKFTSLGGQSRSRLGSLDATTGAVTPWNPGASGGTAEVRALLVDGDLVYVGGVFTICGGKPRNRIAAVDAAGMATAWDPNAGGASGVAVNALASSGDTVLVGAVSDGAINFNPSSAYVFTRSGNTWTQQAKLVAADGAASDYFGWSVAVDGDTALVGAVLDAVGANSFQGSVYVFARSGTTWTQQAELTAGDGETYDLFGTSVALDGDTALVGAYGDNVGAASDQGSAYVFTRSDTTWTQQAKLVAGDGARGDEFGYSVALDGDTALVGAYQDYVGANSGQGSAYVFTRSDTTWTQQTKLVAGDGEAGDRFGISVALDGDTALVGAHSTGALNINPGSAYVFTRGGTTWLQQAKLLAGDGVELDLFGTSVDLDGDTALVGAHGYDVGVNSYQGSAYVFTRRGTTWAQAATLTAATGAAADHFGTSVALSSTMALVGAPTVDGLPPYGNPDEGAAYVFRIVLTMFANGFEEPARAITVPRR